MSNLTKWMDKKFYADYGDNWDDDIFRKILERNINSETVCLDYGAGRGNVKQMNFRGIAKYIMGVDPDEAVLENLNLDEARVINSDDFAIPCEDSKFDTVFSDNVMEHVQNPSAAFNEIWRVLRPGGVFLSKTPNKWHYMPLIARATPTSFHRFYNTLRGRKEFDTFPTLYNCNTKASVQKFARETGFSIDSIQFIEGRPEYLRLTAPTYLFGLLYERAANLSDRLAAIRAVMIFKLTKRSKT